ncbi:MAG: hypothetical protein M3404_05110 [Actinomycetota bacterium]|nr:hypothetical protein [Actinomycetota bacterium]
MKSDAKHYEDDWSGTVTRPGVQPLSTGGLALHGGYVTDRHIAILRLQRLVLGVDRNTSPVLGSLSLTFGLYDLREWLRSALEQVENLCENDAVFPGKVGG